MCWHNSKSTVAITKDAATIAETAPFINKLHYIIVHAITTTIAIVVVVERKFTITEQIAAYSYSHRLFVLQHLRYFHYWS